VSDRGPGSGVERWLDLSAFGLVAMATWTLVIKYLAPLLWVIAERARGEAGGAAPIMWDFWWAAHLVLAWMLWRRHRWAWMTGMTVAGIEVAIVSIKFLLYADDPDGSFWKLLWLTNKIYVLLFFLFLLVLLSRYRVRIRLGVEHGQETL